MEERNPVRPHGLGSQFGRQRRRVAVARADDDRAAAIEPAQHGGALHGALQAEPPLGGFDLGHIGRVAVPFAPFADGIVGHDVDDLPGQPIAPVHGLDLVARQGGHEEGIPRRLVLAAVQRGREVRQAVERGGGGQAVGHGGIP